MTRGTELDLIRRKAAESLWLLDAMPIPTTPAFQFIRADIVRLLNSLAHADREAERASK